MGRRADRGVNGPRAIREPQAAPGVACCRWVAYTTLPGSRASAHRERRAATGVEIPVAKWG
ncbi:MAG: hypothetical protein Q4A17_04520 [Thermoguttaceae bacterium]|nr:hypothetical protein [Thermoguttaceae bacterium]